MRFCLLLLLFAAACSTPPISDSASQSPTPADMSDRIGPSLSQQLRSAPADSVLGATVRTVAELDQAQRGQVEATGASIQTVTGSLFTMRGTPAQIRAVAALPFVVSMDNETSFPNG